MFKKNRSIQICTVALLGSALLFLTSCDDDDDDPVASTTVVGQAGQGQNTADPEENAAAPEVAQANSVQPPENIIPAHGTIYKVLAAGGTYPVKFQWTAVPGAVQYTVYVDAGGWVSGGTSITRDVAIGTHVWWVVPCFNDPDRPGFVVEGVSSVPWTIVVQQVVMVGQ